MMSKSNNSIPFRGSKHHRIAFIAVIAIAVGIYAQQVQKSAKTLPSLTKAIILPNTKALSHVDFVDQDGAAFTMDDLKGYWNIVFFGFTNCPDICPTTMRTLQLVKEQLDNESKWGNYRVIMVSVDPERDTQERLKNYVPYFDEEFVGLRSDEDTTTEFAKQLGILFIKQKSEDGFYQVDHSASLILINPAGEMAGVITAPHKQNEISNDLLLLADYFVEDHAQIAASGGHNTLAKHSSDASKLSHAVSPSAVEKGEAISGLVMSEAWIRPAPPNVNSMAAYFRLQNQTDIDVVVTAVQSSDFAMVMMHDTVIENDIAKMQHLNQLTIPANGEVIFAPLGKHLMLVQADKPLGVGDSASITLISDDGAQISQTIKVKQPVQ